MSTPSKRILFIVPHRPGRSPGQRFRFEQYLGFLERHGYSYDFSSLIDENDDAAFYSKGHYLKKLLISLKSFVRRFRDMKRAGNYDLIFIYREAIMFGTVFFEKRFAKTSVPVVLDFDDSIWLMDISEGNNIFRMLKRPEKTPAIIKLCRHIITGNQYLADYALQFNPSVSVIPTTIDTSYYIPPIMPDDETRVCIGWTGSHTTNRYFEMAIPWLKSIRDKYGDKVSFLAISDIQPKCNGLDVEFIKWKRETEVQDLSQISIGIMPLTDDQWSRGKCGFKGLQYMALGIPAVLSAVGVNNEIVTDGVNGFLVSSGDEWLKKLSLLIENPDLRKSIGIKGRERVVEQYSYESQKYRYLNLFDSLCHRTPEQPD